MSLRQAKALIEDGRVECNTERPHSALGDLTPQPFARAHRQQRFFTLDAMSALYEVWGQVTHTWNGSPNDPNAVTASMRLALGHAFLGKTKTEFQANNGYVPFRSDLSGTWGEARAAITGNVSKKVALYATTGYERALNGGGHQWDGKIGVRISW